MNILSLMSGSSLDGIDIGIIQIDQNDQEISWKIIDAKTFQYTKEWKEKLVTATQINTQKLLSLNAAYARYNASLVLEYLSKTSSNNMPAAISFHGHTIFHNIADGYSFQLGCSATLAALTKYPVVGDFRTMDIALGGQGAPLMAIVDELLFPEYSINLNLGGICNLSTNSNHKYVAYDIAPCNQLLNCIAGFKGLDYDEDGKLASSGKVQNDFLEYLESDKYYSLGFPKSLDNSYIRTNILVGIDLFGDHFEDLMYTACYFIAKRIKKEIQELIKRGYLQGQNLKMLLTGGGALNVELVKLIQEFCKVDKIEIIVPDQIIVEYKELLLMGLLAYNRIEKKTNVFAKYTGAINDSISACLYEG